MKTMIRPLLMGALALLGSWLFWQWMFCRFYVQPGHMAILVAKDGKPLPPDQILAESGQKGVQEEVLGEGRHFRNPIAFEWRIQPCITIPPGKVGVVTAKVGESLPQGEFLAERGQKGVWRGTLGPGRYRLNPYGYQVDIHDAISVPIGYVGVVTSLAGKQAAPGEFAALKEKGIRGDILQPGLYFVNPKEFKIDVLEVGVNQVSMQGKEGGAVITKAQISSQNRAIDELQFKVLENQAAQRDKYASQEQSILSQAARPRKPLLKDLASSFEGSFRDRDRKGEEGAVGSSRRPAPAEPSSKSEKQKTDTGIAQAFVVNQFVGFPSRDGFEISLDMTVELELEPPRIPRLFRDYGDLPAVAEKIIIPQILSVSRLKGSAYRATDFIVGEGREKFQSDLTEALRKSLSERQIKVHNALIRHVNVPDQILGPIQQRSVAQEQDLTNQERQNTARKQAELNTEQSLIDQRGAEVAQETAKLKAEIKAQKEKQVAEIAADGVKMAAEIARQTATLRAERVKKLGHAEAEAIQRVEGEKARGFVAKTKALGDPVAFNMAEFAGNLNPDVKINIIHAGEGTLWTDLERASLGELGGAKVVGEKKPEKK
jgi:regulator of protease activity HflC (stomatin/prohibitin superfamily)